MSIQKLFKINYKKIIHYKSRLVIFVLPIAILLGIGVVLSSQVSNIVTASKETIVNSSEKRSQIIEINRGLSTDFSMNKPTDYKYSDINKINKIKNIDSTLLAYNSLYNGKININGESWNLDNLTVINNKFSDQYTDEKFKYNPETKTVPIILNTNTLRKDYQDWNNKTEIKIEETFKMFSPGDDLSEEEPHNEKGPIKNKIFGKDQSTILNKQFTTQFGGLSQIPNYSTKFKDDFKNQKLTITYKKDTEKSYNKKLENQKSKIAKYWDYDELAKPLEYTFKVVGFVKSKSSQNSYVPKSFVDQLHKDIYNKQKNSAIQDPELNLLGKVFKGIEFNGLTVKSNVSGGGDSVMVMEVGEGSNPMGAQQDSEKSKPPTYTIPGLILKVKKKQSTNFLDSFSSSKVESIYKNSNAFNIEHQTSTKILIKVKSIEDRSQVVKELNELGYKANNSTDLEIFKDIQNNITTASEAFIWFFVAIVVLILSFNINKLVTDSKKEIGVFRALGYSKDSIKALFVLQILSYSLISVIMGLALSVLGNYAIHAYTHSWFVDSVSKSIKDSFGTAPNTSLSIFLNLDIQTIYIYIGSFTVISIILAMLFTVKMTKISPVESMRE